MNNLKRKHAYLIVAHNEFRILKKLLAALDDERCDIFLHIDKSNRNIDYDELKKQTSNSRLFILNQMFVPWGGDKMIKCTLRLLENAIENNYEYYHLISGVDIPLKTQDEINLFFDANKGKEFLGIDKLALATGNFFDRIKYYHFFQNIKRKNTPFYNNRYINILIRLLDKISIKTQKILHVNRMKSSKYKFYKGNNWFSITHNLALFVLENKSFIKKHCYFSICADEIFINTIALNSPYKDNLGEGSLREIDWSRQSAPSYPYIYTHEDYDLLINSKNLFARKFSDKTDPLIVDMLFERLR